MTHLKEIDDDNECDGIKEELLEIQWFNQGITTLQTIRLVYFTLIIVKLTKH